MNLETLKNLMTEAEIEFQAPEGKDFLVVELPGTKRLKTVTLLMPAKDSVRVEAFVCRAVEEKQAEVFKFLLQRNNRSFGVAYTLDANSDIYLAGQLPGDISAEDLDRVLGQVLESADGDFNKILEMGFEESIRKEWAWRLDRGESTKNLEAFQSLKPSED